MVERARAARAKADSDRWRNAYQLAASVAASATDEMRAERLTRVDERERLERVIAQQKAGIAQLEEDIDACEDPGVVRDRLRRLLLLGGSAPVTGAAAAPAGPRVPG